MALAANGALQMVEVDEGGSQEAAASVGNGGCGNRDGI